MNKYYRGIFRCYVLSMATHWWIFLCVFCFVSDLPPQVYAQCDGRSMIYADGTGEIRSPHYPSDEYNKSANCTWEFDPRSTDEGSDFAVVFTITQLRLFGFGGGSKRCLGSYNLTIGGERIPCDEYVKDDDESFPCLYSSSSCDSLKEVQKCKTTRQSTFPVSIEYFSDGRTDASITTTYMYFRISCNIVPCLKVSETTTLYITETPIQKESRTSTHDVDETSRILFLNLTETVTSPLSSSKAEEKTYESVSDATIALAVVVAFLIVAVIGDMVYHQRFARKAEHTEQILRSKIETLQTSKPLQELPTTQGNVTSYSGEHKYEAVNNPVPPTSRPVPDMLDSAPGYDEVNFTSDGAYERYEVPIGRGSSDRNDNCEPQNLPKSEPDYIPLNTIQ